MMIPVLGAAAVLDGEMPADALLIALRGKAVTHLNEVRGRGRPATGFDKKAYDREKARQRRAAAKEKP